MGRFPLKYPTLPVLLEQDPVPVSLAAGTFYADASDPPGDVIPDTDPLPVSESTAISVVVGATGSSADIITPVVTMIDPQEKVTGVVNSALKAKPVLCTADVPLPDDDDEFSPDLFSKTPKDPNTVDDNKGPSLLLLFFMAGSNVEVSTLNCQGIRSSDKHDTFFSWLNCFKVDFICL